MRARALAFVLFAACGPAVSTAPVSYDEDLGPRAKVAKTGDVDADAVATEPARPITPAGAGIRTGAITRARLNAALDAGPAAFLRQIEVAPRLNGERFVGWQLVQLVDHASPLATLDLAPGDVLLAINGKPIAKPDQLQEIWDSLRNAPAVTALMWRGATQFEIKFTVDAPTPIADAQ